MEVYGSLAEELNAVLARRLSGAFLTIEDGARSPLTAPVNVGPVVPRETGVASDIPLGRVPVLEQGDATFYSLHTAGNEVVTRSRLEGGPVYVLAGDSFDIDALALTLGEAL